jgi:PAS domain S-box-containing protein
MMNAGTQSESDLKKLIQELEVHRAELDMFLLDEHWKLERIIEGARLGTWEWNVLTGEMAFNDRWAEIIGYESDEIGSSDLETWMKFAHPDDFKLSGELMEKYLRGESDYYECEARIKHKNGNWIWVRVNGKVHKRDKAGNPLTVLGTRTDITARKHYEDELRLRGEILDNMEEGVFLIGSVDGTIIYANPKAEQLLGYNPKELIGTHISSVLAPGERNPTETIREIIQHLKNNRIWQGELLNKRKDGTVWWGHVNLSAFKHPQFGRVWIAIGQDITARKMAEQAMRISEEKYKTTLNASPDGILFIDLNGIITEVSEIGLELFGADSKDDLIGKNFNRFVLSDDLKTIKE